MSMTVAQALERRGRCRAGLRGLEMLHTPSGRRFTCGGSVWNRHSRLELFLGEERLAADSPTRPTTVGRFTFWEGADLARAKFEPRDQVPAEECRLLEPWPVLCCRPQRRKHGQS